MRGIAIERWTFEHTALIEDWLGECSGPSTKETWFIDQDYDLLTLVMSEELYVMYKLRYVNEKV